MLVGVGYSRIDLIFLGSIRILFCLIMNPRNLTSFQQNSHFSSTVLKVIVASLLNTTQTSLVYCSFVPLVKIRISSKQAKTVILRRSYRTLLIIRYIITGTLVSPIGITKNLQSPYLVLIAVFYSSPSFIRILQKASRKSIFVYQLDPVSRFYTSSILGRRYLSLIVTSLSFL